jgi:hypothetical protein
MPHSETHPVDESTQPNAGITRRTVLLGIATVAAETTILSWPNSNQAQTLAAPAPSTPLADTGFLKLSQALTGHTDLNAETAERIYAAMARLEPQLAAQVDTLAGLTAQSTTPQALLEAAGTAGLRDLALGIVAAWYTGTVGKGTQAAVVSYAEALMYRPVNDALTVPTYCNFGPLWWTAKPPSPDALPSTSTSLPS